MQTRTFLCLELQVAPRRLRETFAQSQVPAKTREFEFTKPPRDGEVDRAQSWQRTFHADSRWSKELQ
jgi:hypothetical protein